MGLTDLVSSTGWFDSKKKKVGLTKEKVVFGMEVWFGSKELVLAKKDSDGLA